MTAGVQFQFCYTQLDSKCRATKGVTVYTTKHAFSFSSFLTWAVSRRIGRVAPTFLSRNAFETRSNRRYVGVTKTDKCNSS